MILLIGYEKGGVGKSTLAKNLAVYLQQMGRDVMTVDTDPQQSLYKWSTIRAENPNAQDIPCIKLTGSKILSDLRSLAPKYDDLIIDAGGADSPALRAAMTVATHMLIPMQAAIGDMEPLEHMCELLEQVSAINPNLFYRAVLTMCPALPSQAGFILDAKDAVRSYDIEVLNAYTTRRLIYDQAHGEGLTALESNNVKASQDIIDIAEELLSHV
jgi:chromosome partitioning protein